MRLMLQLEKEDQTYLPWLKPLLHGNSVRFNVAPVNTITEVVLRAEEFQTKQIVSTSQKLLTKLLGAEDERAQPHIDDYAGSIIDRSGYEFLFVRPLDHIVSSSYGKFLLERYLSKYLTPAKWFPIPAFTWEIGTPGTLDSLYAQFASCDYIAQDIETIEEDISITCSCHTGIWFDRTRNTVRIHSVVIPCIDEFHLAWIRRFNLLPAPKIFQNGKYDNAYYLRWRAPVRNWKFDTLTLFHCWLAELPKRLDFIAAFAIRKWVFWKEERNVPIHSYEYYRYNAKDGFTTALSFLSLLAEMPAFAFKNYELEFPINYPCLLAEMTGIPRETNNFDNLKKEVERSLDVRTRKLRRILGEPNFNPGSSQQCVKLWKVLGSSDIVNSDVKAFDKVKYRHPLNAFIVEQIESIRKDRKLASSYLKDGVVLNNRFMYSINPHGTKTGRNNSKEHHYYCGLQIQNIPVRRTDLKFKEVFRADDGFFIGEGDYEQAETRDTAYITGDSNLLRAISSDKDFHALNASAFFGLAYEDIMGPTGEVLNKEIRDLSKRTNHGATYNMGAKILLETMGIKNILRARDLLKLPKSWGLLRIAEHLLECFANTYPVVKTDYQTWVKYQVKHFKTLVGATGWTRYCFGNPEKNKKDLNGYVAHCPQSLNAMTLNQAWWRVFCDIALAEPKDFKLAAQIHDSILFQYRIGRVDLAHRVSACMLMDIPVVDIAGITRSLRVPVAMKGEANIWANIKKLSPPSQLATAA